MSKPIKELVIADYKKRFESIDGALLVDIRGMTSNDTNDLRLGLQEKRIRVTVVKNALAKKAFTGTDLEALNAGLVGPSAVAYGDTSVVDVARQLVEWARKIKHLTLKGAVLDGTTTMALKASSASATSPPGKKPRPRSCNCSFRPPATCCARRPAPAPTSWASSRKFRLV